MRSRKARNGRRGRESDGVEQGGYGGRTMSCRRLSLPLKAGSMLLIALFVSLVLGGQPTGAVQGNQGLQAGWAVDDSGQVAFSRSVSEQLPAMKQAGAGWVRVNFRLGACFSDWTSQGCNGKTALDTYAEVVAAAGQSGLKVLGLLSNESWHGDQAQWVANNAEKAGGDGDNDYLRAFSSQAAVPLARHFGGRIASWEVWNEPNAWTSGDGAGRYWGGTFIYPSNFAWLLRHVYEDARLAGLIGLQFISGGLLGHDIGGVASTIHTAAGWRAVVKQGTFSETVAPAGEGARPVAPAGKPGRPGGVSGESGDDYLRATYDHGRRLAGWEEMKTWYGSYPLDGIGQHLYVDQGGTTSSSKIKPYLDELRKVYVAYEGRKTAKQTHVTEFGWQTSAIGEDAQASNLRVAYGAFRDAAYVARAYWFFIQDIPEASLFFGLLRQDGSRKPAFAAYQEAAAY